jgi:dienelactone hydrolase
MTHRSDEVPRQTLRLTVGDAIVPAILLLPRDLERKVPAALLLHGYSSHKERMAYTIGRALAIRGIAALAIDLPLHGEREASREEALFNPLALLSHWQLTLEECAAALQWLAHHERCDASRLAIVGYSLGAYIAVTAAAQNTRVRAVVLAAGGDLPRTPLDQVVRSVADPMTDIQCIAGRPILMLNGRFDRTVRPPHAERLFKAAGEPKQMRWFNSGHILPAEAIGEAADWLVGHLESPEALRRARRPVRNSA